MIVTFYSYKGGVGRSMAMANVADVLARRGARVLMIDFDLEAPGIEQYFQIPQPAARRHAGLLDLLLGFKQSMSVGAGDESFRDIDRFILPVYERLPGGGKLDLMPAGQRDDQAQLERYALGVRTFDWQDFYYNWEGELFFEWLRGVLVPERYDLVLVDSRTGVTEMGGICAYQLAEIIIMMCAANHQNLRGTQNVARDFTSPRVLELRNNRPLQIVVVPARIEQRRPELLAEFNKRFETVFGKYLPDTLRQAGLGFGELAVPYEPHYAFEERVLTDPASAGTREAIATSFQRLADALTLLAEPGTPLAKLAPGVAQAQGPREQPVQAQYDATTRFAGYDVHLIATAEDRRTAEALARALGYSGLRVFTDVLEAVPPSEWRRRSETILFHTKACVLVIGAAPTRAQTETVGSLLNSVAASRELAIVPVRIRAEDGMERPLPAGLDETKAVDMRAWPRETAPLKALLARLGVAEPETLAPTGVATLDDLFVSSGGRATAADPLAHATAGAATPDPFGPVVVGVTADFDAAEATLPPPPIAGAPRPSAQPSTVTLMPGSPFRGDTPYREQDAPQFFGRDALVQAVIERLGSRSIVWLTGPSGCGKTSIVRAGVVPALRRAGAMRSIHAIALTLHADPLRDLAALLERDKPDASGASRRLVFIDELQVLRGRSEGAHHVEQFVRQLLDFAREMRDVVLLVAVREHHLAAIRASGTQIVEDNVVRVTDLAPEELRAVIEKPAERAGLAFEPGLADRVIKDLGAAAEQALPASALPLVQLVLQRLWERRREGWLTNAAYDEAGGAQGLIVARADAALQTLPEDDRGRLLGLMTRLVQLGVNAEDRRRRTAWSDLRPTSVDEHMPVAKMIDQRVLVVGADATGAPWLELAHEALAQRWPPLRQRIEGDRELLLWRQRLSAYRADWERSGRDNGALLSGELLSKAQTNARQAGIGLSAAEQGYIEASAAYARRMRNIRRYAYAVLLVLVLVPLWLGYRWWEDAQQQQATAAVLQADAAAARGDDTSAIDAYTMALKRAVDKAALYSKRGQAYAALGNFDQAIADFGAAIDSTPEDAQLYALRGEARMNIGDAKGALADFDREVALASGDARAYFSRGGVRSRLGDQQGALADFTRAIELRPDYADALFSRGLLYEKLDNRSAAIKDFTRVLALPIDADTRTAAQARLDQLGAKTQIVQTRRPRVLIKYASESDRDVVANVRNDLLRSNLYDVSDIELQSGRRTVGDVRYVAGDEKAAADVSATVEMALAKQGYRMRLQAQLLEPPQRQASTGAKTAAVDTPIEVWLPPLASASIVQNVEPRLRSLRIK